MTYLLSWLGQRQVMCCASGGSGMEFVAYCWLDGRDWRVWSIKMLVPDFSSDPHICQKMAVLPRGEKRHVPIRDNYFAIAVLQRGNQIRFDS